MTILSAGVSRKVTSPPHGIFLAEQVAKTLIDTIEIQTQNARMILMTHSGVRFGLRL
ncbi:MAG: hypothetical protein ABI690_24920 [Chloroflexota bacterium]